VLAENTCPDWQWMSQGKGENDPVFVELTVGFWRWKIFNLVTLAEHGAHLALESPYIENPLPYNRSLQEIAPRGAIPCFNHLLCLFNVSRTFHSGFLFLSCF
jgi:hypothetical protein